MDNLIIHIGYHKTATSWLQKEFFENDNLNVNSLAPYDGRARWVTEFIKPDYLFDESIIQSYYKETKSEIKVNVLSIERLSGYPITGGVDALMIANRLKKLFPFAKILISLREQKSMIKSIYVEHLKGGGDAKLDELLYPQRFYLIRNPTFNLDYFKYDYLVEEYLKLFGDENVLVLPYEMLRKDPDIYIEKLSSLLGLIDDLDAIKGHLNLSKKINTQYQLRQAYINRQKSRFFGSDCTASRLGVRDSIKSTFTWTMNALPVDWGEKLKDEIDTFFEKEIPNGFYAESNSRLEQLVGDKVFSKYGYGK